MFRNNCLIEIEDKMRTGIEKLHDMMETLTKENVMVAFSGGVDSSLLLQLACSKAQENGTAVYAVTVSTKLHPHGDVEIARRVADEAGAIHRVIEIDELQETGIENNPKNRCYLCKKGIFTKIMELARTLGISTIIEGTNEDDLHVYRPGIQALKELGIISPLAACGITKAEVRELALARGISVANRPSMPCLATRLPYGDSISYELLAQIDKGEQYVRSFGFYNVRLRVHDTITRIEVDQKDIPKLLEHREEIIAELKKLGFVYITVDLEGFRSGSMDL